MTSDEEIVSICQSEMDNASGYSSGELADQRAQALDYYLGEPLGTEEEGRSQIITREVLETVEWVLPSLIRIFTDSENMVMFDPTGPEDVEQAKQESELVNHVYWKENRGFYNTYTFCKDALLSKNGVLMAYWDESNLEEREEYENLDDYQLGQLMYDEDVEREILEVTYNEDGTYDAAFKATTNKGKIVVDVVPPEEFGVSRDARSPFVDDLDFCYRRMRKSVSELVEMGYEKSFLDTLPSDDDVATQERTARRNLSDEEEGLDWSHHDAMRTIWVTECYVRLDRDGDGIAELLKVTLASGSHTAAGAQLMDIEEIDSMPFSSASPILLTHKFHGLSIADLVLDLQEIRTTLTRQMLDNTYLANNQRTMVNDEYVNIDDLLTSRPGGVVRYEGDGQPGQYLMPIPHNPLPQEAYQMIEYLDEIKKQRTGVGDEVAGLDKASLANVNTGVAALAYDAARMKIELIARIIAEVGFRPLFHKIHEILLKKQDRVKTIQLSGEYIPIDPSEWRTRINSTIMVGVGTVSRERRIMGLEAVLAKQAEEMQLGGAGSTITPNQRFETLRQWTDAWGLEATQHWQNPAEAPPPPPPPPDPQTEALKIQGQALMAEVEVKREQNILTAKKNELDNQIKQFELQQKGAESALKFQIEQMKQQITAAEAAGDLQDANAKIQLQAREQALKDLQHKAALQQQEFKTKIDDLNEENRLAFDKYKADLDASVKVAIAEAQQAKAIGQQVQSQPQQQNDDVSETLQAVLAELSDMKTRASAPQKVIRDAEGLIVQIGEKKIIRDETGSVTDIE